MYTWSLTREKDWLLKKEKYSSYSSALTSQKVDCCTFAVPANVLQALRVVVVPSQVVTVTICMPAACMQLLVNFTNKYTCWLISVWGGGGGGGGGSPNLFNVAREKRGSLVREVTWGASLLIGKMWTWAAKTTNIRGSRETAYSSTRFQKKATVQLTSIVVWSNLRYHLAKRCLLCIQNANSSLEESSTLHTKV